ncbi:MAG: apolipoprotein N-acyltransferase [Bacteroidia bacterium]
MWIQWYEWTGSLGGSLWILSVNILITQWLLTGEEKRRKKMYSVLLLIVIPCAVSAIRYYTYTEAGKTIRVVSTQPNIDPYSEKFSGMSNEEQIIRVLQLANLESPDSADYILAPETAIANSLWESELENYSEIKLLRSYIKAYPHVRLIIGASTNKLYASDEKLSATARRFTQQDGYYDSYNTALFIQSEKPLQIFHKSKLVPGVERMPYPKIFGFLEKLSINMGGTSGSLGVQPEPTVFISSDSVVTAPVICYESIYGDYLAEYVRKGAQWIAVITNDGWWGNTPGYRQHFQYARIHAIELRRDIARSANTGISGFINQRGDVLQQTPYWQEAVIRERITLNNQKTVYVRYGDYIGVIAACLILPLLLTAFLKRRKSI